MPASLQRPAAAAHPDRPSSSDHTVINLGLVVLAGLALGVLTAYAQGWLGGDLNALANSAGPWSLAAFILAMLARGGPRLAAASGLIVLIMLELGYVLGSNLKGNSSAASTILFWVAAAVVVGPALGLGAYWVRVDHGIQAVRAVLGASLMSGILIGEGIYEITRVHLPAFGTGEILAGVALFALLASRRFPVPRLLLQAGVVTAAVSTVLFAAYLLV